ncbi:MAG: aminotransferase class V-fold PLP-dependent enzyme [Anaerolineales bacterium]|nr:aminotransferase class V-fold PLP-dependent enzyme [Anaerolineales bacterium]MDW8447837.1 aminotransferase class V-fold PLP-dependent enzyme [Anaerolineales bacterium]
MDIAKIQQELQATLKPYKDELPSFRSLPKEGLSRAEVVDIVAKLAQREAPRWQSGKVSGAVYHGDPAHIEFQNTIYNLQSQANPLHMDLWPSITKFEAEIIAMTAHMLGADYTEDEIVGSVSSGGTESILLAMKAYRDWARATKNITEPEIIAPSTAHVAFEKAAQYFGMRLIRVPVGEDFRADVRAMEEAITPNTVVMVGSAPPFPHGIVDPIEELSEIARQRGIGFHTDACLGGFVLPWAERLGYPVPKFDFRLPGVTSMSCDTHKYGYAAKGTSVVLYRGRELRHHQYFVSTDWCGGIYISPTLTGSRPGGLSAAAWAAMVSMGESGYLEAARRILKSAETIKKGIACIPELQIIGDPLFVIAFTSKQLDIYAVLDVMSQMGWNLNGLQNPPAIHIAVTIRHTQEGVPERFLEDLRRAVEIVKSRPEMQGSMTPVYGMTSNVFLRGAVDQFLRNLLDTIFEA